MEFHVKKYDGFHFLEEFDNDMDSVYYIPEYLALGGKEYYEFRCIYPSDFFSYSSNYF